MKPFIHQAIECSRIGGNQGAFIERISVETIAIAEDCSIEFCHDDGNLFWGHSIVVHGLLENGLTRAGMEG